MHDFTQDIATQGDLAWLRRRVHELQIQVDRNYWAAEKDKLWMTVLLVMTAIATAWGQFAPW